MAVDFAAVEAAINERDGVEGKCDALLEELLIAIDELKVGLPASARGKVEELSAGIYAHRDRLSAAVAKGTAALGT